jgi:hypothetical protein
MFVCAAVPATRRVGRLVMDATPPALNAYDQWLARAFSSLNVLSSCNAPLRPGVAGAVGASPQVLPLQEEGSPLTRPTRVSRSWSSKSARSSSWRYRGSRGLGGHFAGVHLAVRFAMPDTVVQSGL